MTTTTPGGPLPTDPVHGTWEPDPAARWEDGFLSGNGRHGALVFGDPNDARVVVTHHTLVRPNGAEDARPPQLADRLTDLQDRLLAGETDAGEDFTDGRPLQWVQPFHPAFQIRLTGPGSQAPHHRRSVDFSTGEVTTAAEGLLDRVFVSRADDVIVQHLALPSPSSAPGLTRTVFLDHRLPGAPSALGVGHGAVRVPEGALLTLRARYPGSDRAYTGVTLIAVTGGTTTLVPQQATFAPSRRPARSPELFEQGGPPLAAPAESPSTSGTRASGRHTESTLPQALGFARAGGTPMTPLHEGQTLPAAALAGTGAHIEGADAVLILTRVRRHTGELDVTEETRALREILTGRTYDDLLARHLAEHRTAYTRVTLDLAADPAERALPGSELLKRPGSPALLERLFAAGRYHLLSASGLFPPRLTGLWTGDWDTAWAGAFTTDANLNLQTASAAAAALPEVTEAHAALVRRQWADWRTNARDILGTRGVLAPAHTDGENGHLFHFSREYPLHLWTAGADWLLKPLVDHDETTGARDPRTAAALAEVAEFYEDFLTRTDTDGHLVVVPSYSPENRPANGSRVTLNAAMDLSAARHALRTAADHHPGPDADRLRALADRLPPHRVNADGALAEWAWPGLEDTYDHRHLSHLYAVWPLDEINPYDTPALAEAAHRALELRGAENDSAHGYLHHALIAARLRDPERVMGALTAVLEGDFFHDSLMSAHYPRRHVYNADAAHTLPAVLIEMLVQSTPDRLVLLPALPAAYPAGELRGVRTRFAAELDLSWAPGALRAVLRPHRTHRVELRTSSGAQPLDLVAGEDHVLTLGTW